MKNILFILFAFILFASCTKEGENLGGVNTESSEPSAVRYYVKYKVSTEYTQAGGQYRDHTGNMVGFSGNGEYVVGPVEKGFNAKMVLTSVNRATICNISVCIFNEPFTLRASKSSYGDCFTLEYNIE